MKPVLMQPIPGAGTSREEAWAAGPAAPPARLLLIFSSVCVSSLNLHPLYMGRVYQPSSVTRGKFNRGVGIKSRSRRSKPSNGNCLVRIHYRASLVPPPGPADALGTAALRGQLPPANLDGHPDTYKHTPFGQIFDPGWFRKCCLNTQNSPTTFFL